MHGSCAHYLDLLRKPLFIPTKRKVSDLLGDFRKNRTHIAITVDEYGVLRGLISFQDLIDCLFSPAYLAMNEQEAVAE